LRNRGERFVEQVLRLVIKLVHQLPPNRFLVIVKKSGEVEAFLRRLIASFICC